MKTIRKLLSLGLGILLILCLTATVSLNLFAEEIPTLDTSLNIAYCNLSFRDSVVIKYAVRSEFVEDPAQNIKLLIWTAPQTEYTLGTQAKALSSVNTQNINGVDHVIFDYTDLTARQMTDTVYARAYTEIDGTVYYSDVVKYSVLQYAYSKLGKLDTPASEDAELRDMLIQMLEYGASAQKYFDYKLDSLATDSFYQVKVVGGTLEDGMTSGLYRLASTVTISAPEENTDGDKFLHWANGDGNEAATSATAQITVGEKNETYTAVYETPSYSRGLEFTSNGDGTCYVSGIGTCTDSDIIIPEVSPEGDTVTAIGHRAFSYCAEISGVSIPESVTSINEHAFGSCSSLTSINIPENVTNIGADAFSYCESLSSINIPDSVTSIGSRAFYHCTSLSSIVLPKNITTISDSLFLGCTRLASVNIPDNVTTIGDSALRGCYLKAGITFGENSKLKTIGSYAFSGSRMRSLILPNSVESIYPYAFSSNRLETVSIPNNVTYIGTEAFANNNNLVFNEYGNALYLGNDSNPYFALISASNAEIDSCEIHQNTKIISEYAFAGSKISEVTISKSVNFIGHCAFYNCTKLTTVKFSESCTVKEIGIRAFDNCVSLENFVIPESVTTIKEFAFNNCKKLASISIPKNVLCIEGGVFSYCSSLSQITVDEDNHLFRIEGNCLISNENKEVLRGCVNSNIPEGIEIIGVGAFSGCKELAAIAIPDSTIKILDMAFGDCINLVSVTIPYNVTYVDDYAFVGCNRLVELISKSGTPYGGSTNHFIEIHSGESKIVNSNDYLFYTYNDVNYLVAYVGEDTVLKLPDSYEGKQYKIYYCAFEQCDDITAVIIPGNLEYIGYGAFYDCFGLTHVYYHGAESNWNNISIEISGNDPFLNATLYYYSEAKPTTEGNYWHYVNGVPTVW